MLAVAGSGFAASLAHSPRTTPIHGNAVIASVSPSLLVSVLAANRGCPGVDAAAAGSVLCTAWGAAEVGAELMSAGQCGGEGFHSPIVRLVLLLLQLCWLGWARGRGWVDNIRTAGSQMGAG
jgi:hypothetical protein